MADLKNNYLLANKKYWEKGYPAPNVDHYVFRFFGHILKPQFNLPLNNEKLLDFGCGSGAAVNFFYKNGFNSQGVDMPETDLSNAKLQYPQIKDKFFLCNPDPKLQPIYGTETSYKVITAFQSLYYLSKSDFEIVINKLHNQLEPGGIFFATMMGSSSKDFYDNSKSTDDEWLRKVDFKHSRLNITDYFISFVKNEDDLLKKFSIFMPIHVGYYSEKFRSDEGESFHYTFCGMKR